MKKVIYFPALLLLLVACNQSQKINIIVENQSGFDLDSLIVYPNTGGAFVELKQGASITYTVDLSQEVSDGAYSIVYRNTTSGELYRDTFGYYSNGQPLEKEIRYQIEAIPGIKALPQPKQAAADFDRGAVNLLVKNLKLMAGWDHSEAFDIDSLAGRTGKQLTELLTDAPLSELDTLENV